MNKFLIVIIFKFELYNNILNTQSAKRKQTKTILYIFLSIKILSTLKKKKYGLFKIDNRENMKLTC